MWQLDDSIWGKWVTWTKAWKAFSCGLLVGSLCSTKPGTRSLNGNEIKYLSRREKLFKSICARFSSGKSTFSRHHGDNSSHNLSRGFPAETPSDEVDETKFLSIKLSRQSGFSGANKTIHSTITIRTTTTDEVESIIVSINWWNFRVFIIIYAGKCLTVDGCSLRLSQEDLLNFNWEKFVSCVTTPGGLAHQFFTLGAEFLPWEPSGLPLRECHGIGNPDTCQPNDPGLWEFSNLRLSRHFSSFPSNQCLQNFPKQFAARRNLNSHRGFSYSSLPEKELSASIVRRHHCHYSGRAGRSWAGNFRCKAPQRRGLRIFY